jgi:hypothetical protein
MADIYILSCDLFAFSLLKIILEKNKPTKVANELAH